MYKIYFLDVNKLKESFSFEEIYYKVSSYRKSKVDKLLFDKDKWLSLGAEYLLMQGLREFNIDYSQIEIGLVENNKPFFKNCPVELYFNLSHSGEMAMCVISDSDVGCDIQKVSNKEKILDVAERFFNSSEIEIIKNCKESERNNLFYRIWVIKESYIKATGKGFKMPLKNFKIVFENDIPKAYVNDILDNRFIFKEIDVGNTNYKSAICMKV